MIKGILLFAQQQLQIGIYC